MLDSESIDVTPKQVFAAQLRRPWEMICLLILVQVLDIIGRNVACPLHIKVLIVTLDHVETSILASVDYGVVDVSRVRDLERHKKIVDFLTIVLPNTVCCSLQVDIARVREECRGRSVCEDRF